MKGFDTRPKRQSHDTQESNTPSDFVIQTKREKKRLGGFG